MTTLELEKHLKKTTIRSATVATIISICAVASLFFGFYYQTNDTLQIHTEDIKAVKVDIKDLKDVVTSDAQNKGATIEQIKALDNRITRIETTQDRIEDKIDRVIIQTKN